MFLQILYLQNIYVVFMRLTGLLHSIYLVVLPSRTLWNFQPRVEVENRFSLLLHGGGEGWERESRSQGLSHLRSRALLTLCLPAASSEVKGKAELGSLDQNAVDLWRYSHISHDAVIIICCNSEEFPCNIHSDLVPNIFFKSFYLIFSSCFWSCFLSLIYHHNKTMKFSMNQLASSENC